MNSERTLRSGACGICIAASALSLGSCEFSPNADIPMFSDGGLLRQGQALSRDQLFGFEGIFNVVSGSELFGQDLSIRSTKGTVSLLTDKDAGFAVLGAACLPDQRVVVEGYWQYPTRAEAGLVRLFVDPPELAASLCSGGTLASQSSLQLTGSYGHGDEFPNTPLSLGWSLALKPFRGRFFTVSHHGACEITDHCGVSPNSVETTRLADRTGANAIELDVRVTRDGVPILFHDPALSSSLVRGLFCNGTIADLSLAELRANCTLRYGEALPTLEEALTAMIDETELEGVYLDIKVPEGILPTARIASQTLAALAERNQSSDASAARHFGIIVAITNDDNRTAWHAAKDELATEGLAAPPCLVEYDPDVVLSEGCVAWGPTWTAGPRVADVQRLRAAGAATIFWTLNQTDFIDQYLLRAQPDGIITSRPALLFHRYQKIGTPPALPEGVVP